MHSFVDILENSKNVKKKIKSINIQDWYLALINILI